MVKESLLDLSSKFCCTIFVIQNKLDVCFLSLENGERKSAQWGDLSVPKITVPGRCIILQDFSSLQVEVLDLKGFSHRFVFSGQNICIQNIFVGFLVISLVCYFASVSSPSHTLCREVKLCSNGDQTFGLQRLLFSV